MKKRIFKYVCMALVIVFACGMIGCGEPASEIAEEPAFEFPELDSFVKITNADEFDEKIADYMLIHNEATVKTGTLEGLTDFYKGTMYTTYHEVTLDGMDYSTVSITYEKATGNISEIVVQITANQKLREDYENYWLGIMGEGATISYPSNRDHQYDWENGSRFSAYNLNESGAQSFYIKYRF